MRQRNDWFEKLQFHLFLWWVEEGHQPSLEEAKERLRLLTETGSTADAFTFSKPFPAPQR